MKFEVRLRKVVEAVLVLLLLLREVHVHHVRQKAYRILILRLQLHYDVVVELEELVVQLQLRR